MEHAGKILLCDEAEENHVARCILRVIVDCTSSKCRYNSIVAIRSHPIVVLECSHHTLSARFDYYIIVVIKCHTIVDVRLVGGPNNASGRVEVYYNGRWGTVCDDNWDIDDARVVCRQLGFRYTLDVYRVAYYGGGTGPILFDGVHCSGFESSLFSCRHDGVGEHNCDHSEDAGVRCGNTKSENRLRNAL